MKVLKYTLLLFYIFIFLISSTNLTNNNFNFPEKNIVIIIPSYNNQKWYERNLQSVLCQNYTNFHIIYTDDNSPDGTGELVQAYLVDHDPHKKVSLIQNNKRRGALHNLYTMIHMCKDDAIIVTLDGDDWLADNDVLTRLNTIYSSDEIWLTYGQFKLHPSSIHGWACPMPDYIVQNNAFRDFQHLPTHLRTFYAWLFKKIKLEDLLYHNEFYPMTWDMAMMFPMIEMAGKRHQFIPEIMYIYNDENNISDHNVSRQLQAYLAQIIKKKRRYTPLVEKPTINKKNNELTSDAIIFAQSPKKLTQLLDSLQTYVTGIDKIFIIYKPSSPLQTDEYENIQTLYPHTELHVINEHRSNFNTLLCALYQKTKNNYILFAHDDTQFIQPTSLRECIDALNTTSAYAFYFKLNAQHYMHTDNNLSLIQCDDRFCAWNFAYARDRWSCANSVDCVLHKKTESLNHALQSHYDLTPHGLEAVWANEGNLDRLGLCYNENHTALNSHTADLIIFSYDRPLQLYALLESLNCYVTGINSIHIIYRSSNDRYQKAFDEIAAQFSDVHFLQQQTVHDFKPLTVHALEKSTSDYIIFAVDDNLVKDQINIHECITWLEKTNAYGFYLKLGAHLDYCYTENAAQSVPPHTHIHKNIFSWNFKSGEKDWHYPNTVDMTLYKKKDLVSLFKSLDYTNPNLLEGKWAAWWVQHKEAVSNIGLFYENSKIINIPLNKVQTINILNRDMNLYTPQELLEKFEAGYKMDIAPLYHMENRSVHTEYEPTFIPRV